jgi:hypothetical protein
MVFRLSLFLVLQIYTVILMFFAFFGRMLTSIVALFSLVFPSLVARGQAAVFSTTVSVKRESVQPMELDWIWAICVSLLGQKPATSQDVRFKLFPTPLAWSFSPLTNVSPLWCSLTILKATWLLATVGYVSAREVGKASAGIVGHVSRQLIKHIWNLGLIQFQTLRLDVLNRLEVTGFAPHDRVTSQPFFGLRLGQITSFDPCLSHSLKLWTLALIYRLLDPDQPGDPCGDSLMEVRKRDTGNQTLRSEKTMGFEDSSQRRRVGQPKGYKDGHTLCGSSTTHSRRQTRNTLRPSILEVPIPGFFVCTTNDGYSAAKHYEDCGETEQFFCDYPFDHASWLLTAILDKVPSFCAVDTDCRGTMKSVQLHKLKASNKDKQRILPITVIILQQIQDSSPSTQRLEYLLPASASTVLNVVSFIALVSQ